MNIAVCDDEPQILASTKAYLEEYPMDLSVNVFSSGEQLLKSSITYEIILLDIDMQGKNGIDTAAEIRKNDKQVKIIYITNYTDYTIFAFAVHAFAYLLKPLNKQELFAQLDEAFSYMKSEPQFLEFDTSEGILKIGTTDILYFEYLGRLVMLHTQEKVYSMRKKITVLAKELEPFDFCMPHKSFIVNLSAIKRISGYDIYLTDEARIPLSQKKSSAFRRTLNQYLSQKGARL